MSYTWTKPDGTRVSIHDSGPIRAELDSLRRQIAALRSEDDMGSALLVADYNGQLEEWRRCEREAVGRHLAYIQEIIAILTKRLAWWREYASLENRPVEMSAAQKAIFVTQEDRHRCRGWEHAMQALNTRKEYRLPADANFSSSLEASDACLRVAQQAEYVASELIEDLAIGLPTKSTWDGYYAVMNMLDKAEDLAEV